MYKYNYIKMVSGYRKTSDSFQDRLNLFMERYHLNGVQMAEFANNYARQYGVRVTAKDISNYRIGRCCPKIDKFQAIAGAMGVDASFLAGYGSKEIRSKFQALQKREYMTEKELAAEKPAAPYTLTSTYAKYKKAYAVVEQLLQDGNVHRAVEIKDTLIHCGYSVESAKHCVSTMMHSFKAIKTKQGYQI